MANHSFGDPKARRHFRSDLISVIGAKGFPRFRGVQSKDPFMDELEARTRAGVARQFVKLRPTVRSTQRKDSDY